MGRIGSSKTIPFIARAAASRGPSKPLAHRYFVTSGLADMLQIIHVLKIHRMIGLLAQQLGGKIEVENLNTGSRVVLRMPKPTI
jgi:hypothetical protein